MDKDEFLSKRSDDPLRTTCYGSSSSATPVEYLAEAEMLGRALALRGHTCVNGAGSAGCMAAMNDGASDEGGDIVGVIHEMFVVDGSDWTTEEGGAHSAFHGGRGRYWSRLEMISARGRGCWWRTPMPSLFYPEDLEHSMR